MRSPREVVTFGSGIAGVITAAVGVYLVYFVIEVGRQLHVWPF